MQQSISMTESLLKNGFYSRINLSNKGYSMMIDMMTKDRFSILIEELVREGNLTYMDAICHWCEKNEVEIETVAKLISPIIKEKMTVECQEYNLLKIKSSAKLPI
jgi:hypothetical protein